MDVKALRKIMKDTNAPWSVPDDMSDQVDSDRLAKEFGLGLLPNPPGALTARMPRMRRAEGAPLREWTPGILPLTWPTVPVLPKIWDWRNVRNTNWVTPPRNQGGCGSCVAFASLGAAESHWRIQKGQTNLDIDLSEGALFFANNRQCNPSDPNYGWWITGALDYLVNEGACYEVDLPYRGINQIAQLVEGTERTIKLRGYDSTTSTTQMKRWLFEDGPLVADYTVYEDFFAYWSGGAHGVYTHVTGVVKGGHAVLVVGYDDNQSCWICKNSWTPGTGGDGFFRMGYGQCGIDDRMYLIQDLYEVFTVDEIPYDPRRLRIVDEGANGWLLTDGTMRMKMFDSKEDARNGLRVARRHNRQGFVGRDNSRGAKRMDYIMEYWSGNSGLPYEPLTKTDAIPYNPNNVVAEDLDAAGWRLREGNHWMLLAHDFNDALAILRWVERHTRMCFIGRDNKRANRKQYIMTYWE